MPTAFRSSSARWRAWRFEPSSCSFIASASWSPILCTGFRLVIGSWKIIAISLPRISRSRRGLAVSRSSPFHIAVPEDIALRRGLSPMIVRHVTLFPEPDSPTMPSVWPLSTEKVTPSTARTRPSSVLKYVFRSVTSSSAISLGESDPRVDPRVQQVHDQVEDDDADGGEDDDPLHRRKVECTDRGDRGLAEAGQPVDRLGEDRAAQRKTDVHAEHRHDRQQGVPQHV